MVLDAHAKDMRDLGPVPSEREDEDKCFVGFPSADAAKAAFHAHYPTSFYGGLTALPVVDFKEKLANATLPYRRKKITAGKSGVRVASKPTNTSVSKAVVASTRGGRRLTIPGIVKMPVGARL